MSHACPYCDASFNWGKDAASPLGVKAGGTPGCGENAFWKLHGHIAAAHPSEGFDCPRSGESARLLRKEHRDHWFMRDGYRSCSYCGSMHPEDLFAAIDAGTAAISGTDKNYKIYVDMPAKMGGKAIYSSCSHETPGYTLLTTELCDQHGLDSYAREHYVGSWVKIEDRSPKVHLKFYYQHLDEAGQDRFIEAFNAKKLKLNSFGLYVAPYFARKVGKPTVVK